MHVRSPGEGKGRTRRRGREHRAPSRKEKRRKREQSNSEISNQRRAQFWAQSSACVGSLGSPATDLRRTCSQELVRFVEQ